MQNPSTMLTQLLNSSCHASKPHQPARLALLLFQLRAARRVLSSRARILTLAGQHLARCLEAHAAALQLPYSVGLLVFIVRARSSWGMLLLKAASGLAAEDPVPRTMLAAGAPAARELDAAEAQTVDAGGQAQVSTQTLKAAAGSAQAAGDPPATEAVKPAMQRAAEPPAEDEGLPAASDHAAPASVLGYLRGWQASLCSLFGSAVFVCRLSLLPEPLRSRPTWT